MCVCVYYIYMCVCTQLLQLCPTLCSPVDYNPPPPQGSSVHGDSPGKNTGVGCHALLQGIFPTQGLNRCLLCLLHWQVGYTSATWEAPYAYTCIYPIHTQKHINIHVLHFIVFCTYCDLYKLKVYGNSASALFS